MLVLRRTGASLLLLLGALLLTYGVANTVKSLLIAIHGSRTYGLGGLLGGLIIASLGYSVGAYGLKVWKR